MNVDYLIVKHPIFVKKCCATGDSNNVFGIIADHGRKSNCCGIEEKEQCGLQPIVHILLPRHRKVCKKE